MLIKKRVRFKNLLLAIPTKSLIVSKLITPHLMILKTTVNKNCFIKLVLFNIAPNNYNFKANSQPGSKKIR